MKMSWIEDDLTQLCQVVTLTLTVSQYHTLKQKNLPVSCLMSPCYLHQYHQPTDKLQNKVYYKVFIYTLQCDSRQRWQLYLFSLTVITVYFLLPLFWKSREHLLGSIFIRFLLKLAKFPPGAVLLLAVGRSTKKTVKKCIYCNCMQRVEICLCST